VSPAPRLEWHSGSPEETVALGERLGAVLGPGDFLALRGPLGAGKTTLVRGLAAALGVRDRVSSPTYLLCHEYTGPVPLLHLDAYFESRMDGVLADGLVERFGTAVVVAEWAERLGDWLPPDRLDLELTGEGSHRRLGLAATGPAAAALLDRLRGAGGVAESGGMP